MKTRKRKSEGTDESSALTREWVLVLAAVLSGIAAIINVLGEVTALFWAPALGVIVIGVTGPVAWERTSLLIRSRRRWGVAREFVSDFQHFVRKFAEEFAQINFISARYEIAEALRRVEGTHRLLAPPRLDFLAEAALPFLLRPPAVLRDFSHQVRLFESLLDILKGGYVEQPLRFLKALPRDSFPSGSNSFARVKQQYPAYEKCIMDYCDWAKRFNTAMGERISWWETYMPGDVRPDELQEQPPRISI